MSDSDEPLFQGATEISAEDLQQILLRQEVAKSNALRLRYLVVTFWIALAGLAYVCGQMVGAGSTYRNGIQQAHEYEEAAARASVFPFKIEKQ